MCRRRFVVFLTAPTFRERPVVAPVFLYSLLLESVAPSLATFGSKPFFESFSSIFLFIFLLAFSFVLVVALFVLCPDGDEGLVRGGGEVSPFLL